MGRLSSDILTCRCRHCGKSFPYLVRDAGAQAECPECRGTVLLPGKLQGVAGKRRVRINTLPGILMELFGILLIAWWPIGTIAGPILLVLGWRKNNAWRCSACEALTTKDATRCKACGSAFASD